MAADDALHQAAMAEVVEPALLAVALPGGIDQRQRARRAGAGLGLGREEARLERQRDALGEADADEAAGRDGVAVVDQAHRVGGADHLVPAGRARGPGLDRIQVHGFVLLSVGDSFPSPSNELASRTVAHWITSSVNG